MACPDGLCDKVGDVATLGHLDMDRVASAGHQVVAFAAIGDPEGRRTEHSLLDLETQVVESVEQE